MRGAHEEKSYSCDICGIIIKNKSHIVRHKKTIHEEQKNHTNCQKAYTSKKKPLF